METLFDLFVQEKTYLCNVSPKTIRSYKQAFNAYQRVLSSSELNRANVTPPRGTDTQDRTEITKDTLKDFVIGMREAGLSPGACNVYIRSMNSFWSWCYANGHTKEHLKLKQLKTEKRIFKPLTDQQLRTILSFKPRTFGERRFHTLLYLALDTGCRVDELITLSRNNVDLENLFIRVVGKGSKERIVPFSIECRKVLFKCLQRHSFDLVFPTRHGGKLRYDNLKRDWNQLMTKLGIETDGAFHSLRRTFATNFAREGGNLFALQRILGHASIQTTQRYVGLSVEDLSLAHQKTSLLSRLRI